MNKIIALAGILIILGWLAVFFLHQKEKFSASWNDFLEKLVGRF